MTLRAMIVWMTIVAALCLPGLAGQALAAPAVGEAAVHITVVNCSDLPVYAAGVTLDAQSIRGRLGVPAGTSISTTTALALSR